MKEAVTKVIYTLTQETFQKLLKRYNKCIAAGGDYFEGDKSFMCVLSIKVPIRKKSGNLLCAPCSLVSSSFLVLLRYICCFFFHLRLFDGVRFQYSQVFISFLFSEHSDFFLIWYFYSFRLCRFSFNSFIRWFFTGFWVTVSLLRSSKFFLVF